MSHTSGVERPLDGVEDVGPAEAPHSPAAVAPTASPTTETLEDRQERWLAERERYERRRRAQADP